METILKRTVFDEIKKYKVVGLNGKPKNEFSVYPWDV